jgi:hypothetical protein
MRPPPTFNKQTKTKTSWMCTDGTTWESEREYIQPKHADRQLDQQTHW